MNIKIWDKISSINGVSAETILASRNDLVNEKEVILIEKNGVITNIELTSTLRNNLDLDMELTALEVGEAYINHLKEQEEQAKKDNLTLDELKEKTQILEEENSDLLLDSAVKDGKIKMLENDIADLLFEISIIRGTK